MSPMEKPGAQGRDEVRLETRGAVGWVIISNPPVNALSRSVREGLAACVAAAIADPDIDLVAIRGDGNNFVAGGDIAEFGAPLLPPDMNDVLSAIEASEKPIVACIHGNALGGGLELALACHFRIATLDARLGLPEVTLGLIPGAGGTRRLPRAIGPRAALQMILDGAPIGAARAHDIGLIDAIATEGSEIACDRLAATFRTTALAGRRLGVRALTDAQREEAEAAIAEARQSVRDRWPWSGARRAAIDVVARGYDGSLADALIQERAAFDACRVSGEGRALMHMFFAERAATRLPDGGVTSGGIVIATVGVVGAGTMGRGIALAVAGAGLQVSVFESDAARRDAARAAVAEHFEAQETRGRMTAEAAQAAISRVCFVDSIAGLGAADLVIEAVFESLRVKQEIFAALDSVVGPGAILATNTSTLDVDAIARVTRRPDRVLGLHFFSPAHVMRLLEIVRAPATGAAQLRSAAAFARRIGKTGVIVGNAFGFVANRMIFEYQRQGEFLVEEGATPAEVDRALVAFGMPMGPFAMADMAGLDVAWWLRKEVPSMRRADRRQSMLADLLCERGWFGQKTGQGWFRYEPGARKAMPSPDTDALVAAERLRIGMRQREIADQEILDRCLYALVNEAARILAAGLAARPGDIDVIYVHGFGFPRWRGGPLHWADEVGVGHIHDVLCGWAERGETWLEPAPLLTRMAREGVAFAQLERKGWIGG
jgi:3-hydroxyacyl-CoA dehydrogenase